MKRLSGFRGAAISAGAVTAGFLAAYLLTVGQLRTAAGEGEEGLSRPVAGTEVLAIFVGSSTCGASEYPGLPTAVRSIRRDLQTTAERENKMLVSVGVALDQEPLRGIAFLELFGPFDEILSGGSWMNTGSLAFIVRDLPSRRAIPQLLMVERDVEIADGQIASVQDRLVARKVGAREIVEFAALLEAERDRGGASGPPAR